MAIDRTLLKEVPLFQGLDDDEAITLAAQMDEVRFEAGTQIFRRGDPGGAIFVVASGTVELATEDTIGHRIVFENAGPGDFFGELSLLDGAPRATDALAIQETLALRVDRADLDLLFRQHPASAMDFVTVMGKRLREADRLLRYGGNLNPNEEIAGQTTLIQRVADALAAFSGSMTFLVLHVGWFLAWVLINTDVVPGVEPFDRYPFGLLTMVVSLEAIFLSCFVLISQNRQAARDKIRADVEYQANIKAGLEVSQLHVKLDRLYEEVLARIESLERRGPANPV